jgi:3-isopropylmalate/(R)-2-methylmalate dehydratase small subunit
VARILQRRGRILPLDRANIDTDLIIPSRFMKAVGRAALGEGAFEALRAEPGNVFDDPRRRGASILVTGANFGCGSSREHAVWALQQIGLEAVIAPSFGEIFEANALRNGLLAIRLPEDAIGHLLGMAPEDEVLVDIEAQLVIAPGGGSWHFALDPFRRQCLIEGLDDLAVTAAMEPQILDFERRARAESPWLFPPELAKEQKG